MTYSPTRPAEVPLDDSVHAEGAREQGGRGHGVAKGCIALGDVEALLRRGQTRMIEERLAQAEMSGSLEGYMPSSPESLYYLLMMQYTERALMSDQRVTLETFSEEDQARMQLAATAAFLDDGAFQAAVDADPANEGPLRATRAGFMDMLDKARRLPGATHPAPYLRGGAGH